MKTVCVNASKQYNIHIGTQLLENAGMYISQAVCSKYVAIISDSNVWPIYGDILTSSLQRDGYRIIHYVLPAGEESKSGENFLKILNFLAENKLTRTDCLIALGGGVVGDMTGFVAATYLRGISYIQIPTSLLAMVDSSVGGKTAIDLPAGKNLAGAFWQPSLVLCDLNALSTLPKEIFQDGCAEVIKYAVLFDKSLFSHLWKTGEDFDREYVVARCVELKRDIVNKDERDTGERQLLNLGHTVGHSIEKCSNFAISHGRAVAIGMHIISCAAVKKQLLDANTQLQITQLLHRFSLPTETDFKAQHLSDAAQNDKKRAGGSITLIVPESIGNCNLYPIPAEELESFIKAGLDYGDNHNAK